MISISLIPVALAAFAIVIAFGWVVPLLYHVVHYIYRFITDTPYSTEKHSLFDKINRLTGEMFHLGPSYTTLYDGMDGVTQYFSVAFFAGLAAAGVVLLINFYYFTAIAGVGICLMFVARGVNRLRKALKKHMSDPNAHKGDEE